MPEADYATKADIQLVKTDLAELELRLVREMNSQIWRLLVALVAVAGVAVTVTRFI